MGYKLIACLMILSITAWGAECVDVSTEEEGQFIRMLIPLPQQISIKHKITVPAGKVGIRKPITKDPIANQAYDELVKLLRLKAGTSNKDNQFFIELKLLTDTRASDYSTLAGLPNAEQAYMIAPEGKKLLVLKAINSKGLYYAVQTMRQLLERHVFPKQVVIPLPKITDWPDFDERGLWNHPRTADFIKWMATLKLNHGRLSSKLQKIQRDTRNKVKTNEKLYNEARLMAFNMMPDITHLNFLGGRGLYKVYPELKGLGDEAVAGRYFAHKAGAQHRAPCASQPKLRQILAEWMESFASKGVNEIGCWLTERPAQCQCEECLNAGQFLQEARAFINAWKETKKNYNDFIIRLFISTTSNEKYYKILAELPDDVRIERCCAAEQGRIRHSPRDIFRNPLFDKYAKAGVWTASYDVPVNVNGAVETPEFKLPECSADRIKDFVSQLYERGYKAAYGMMAWGKYCKEICGFNIAALAEWGWNVNGRSAKEFAIAWATRQGYENPDAVGEWASLMGPIEFDVYDSDMPECYSRGEMVDMIKNKKYPDLGKGMFRYYAAPSSFDEKIQNCQKALKIAESFKNPALANETRVVMSYIKLARSIYKVALLNWREKDGLKSQKKMDELLKDLKTAGEENAEAIKAWRTALGPGKWHYRVNDAVNATEKTVAKITDVVQSRTKSE